MYAPQAPVGGNYSGGSGWNDPFKFTFTYKDPDTGNLVTVPDGAPAADAYAAYQQEVLDAYMRGLPDSTLLAFANNPELRTFVVDTLKEIQKQELAAFKGFQNRPFAGGDPPEIKVNPSKCIFVGVPGPTKCPVKPVKLP